MLSSYASNVVIEDENGDVTFDTSNLQYKVHQIRPGDVRQMEQAAYKPSFVNDTEKVIFHLFH